LTLPRHWRRNRDRLVRVALAGGETVTGRITGSGEESARLDIDGTERVIDFADIASALVQIELNRRPRPTTQPEKEN
jgi:ribosome maturation factor RimP